VVDAASYLLSALGIRAIRSTEPLPGARGTRRVAADEIFEGWRFILRHRQLRPLFINTSLVNGLITATAPLLVVLLLRDLEFATWQYGPAFGAPCVGGLIGSRLIRLLVTRFGQHRVLTVSGIARACWSTIGIEAQECILSGVEPLWRFGFPRYLERLPVVAFGVVGTAEVGGELAEVVGDRAEGEYAAARPGQLGGGRQQGLVDPLGRPSVVDGERGPGGEAEASFVEQVAGRIRDGFGGRLGVGAAARGQQDQWFGPAAVRTPVHWLVGIERTALLDA
jgi:hypothetical protein